jgi:hypothetical protein
MARPKGSKNKIQSPYGKNYINPIQPVAEIQPMDEKQAIEEYNTTLNEQDTTLDSFLIETVDNTLASVEKDYMPVKTKSIQKQLLSLMSQIHSEIAPHINSMRKALANADSVKHIGYVLDNENEDYTKLIGIA